MRICKVAQTVAEQIERKHTQYDRRSGQQNHMRIQKHILLSVAQHGSPLRGGRLHTQTEEAERGDGQHRASDVHAG